MLVIVDLLHICLILNQYGASVSVQIAWWVNSRFLWEKNQPSKIIFGLSTNISLMFLLRDFPCVSNLWLLTWRWVNAFGETSCLSSTGFLYINLPLMLALPAATLVGPRADFGAPRGGASTQTEHRLPPAVTLHFEPCQELNILKCWPLWGVLYMPTWSWRKVFMNMCFFECIGWKAGQTLYHRLPATEVLSLPMQLGLDTLSYRNELLNMVKITFFILQFRKLRPSEEQGISQGHNLFLDAPRNIV